MDQGSLNQDWNVYMCCGWLDGATFGFRVPTEVLGGMAHKSQSFLPLLEDSANRLDGYLSIECYM